MKCSTKRICTYLVRLDLHSALIFLFEGVDQGGLQELGDVVDVPAALGGGDGVDERHLLEPVVGGCHSHLPPFAAHLVDALDLVASLV